MKFENVKLNILNDNDHLVYDGYNWINSSNKTQKVIDFLDDLDNDDELMDIFLIHMRKRKIDKIRRNK